MCRAKFGTNTRLQFLIKEMMKFGIIWEMGKCQECQPRVLHFRVSKSKSCKDILMLLRSNYCIFRAIWLVLDNYFSFLSVPGRVHSHASESAHQANVLGLWIAYFINRNGEKNKIGDII